MEARGTDNDNKNKADAENGNVEGKDVTTNPMPNLDTADIKFDYTPSTWTSGNVTVTINDEKESNHNGLHMEYVECSGNTLPNELTEWHDLNGKNQVIARNNENICVRLSDDTNHSSKYCTRKSK